MAKSTSCASSSSLVPSLGRMTWWSVILGAFIFFLFTAYDIRLLAIEQFGTVIHEFDPYFNYRATEYLYNHGIRKFFTWFDDMVWYPLGRPVGTTIYPGMQFTAVAIKKFIVGDRMSLNDVCCYIPAWFGSLASLLVGAIAYECTLDCNTSHSLWNVCSTSWNGALNGGHVNPVSVRRSSPAVECGVLAMGIMAIVPAHLMRSVGGGFDNESVAVSAMCLTFYFWIRSLRSNDDWSYVYGVLSGVAYFYMVAVWGGYIFVLNMVGLHAVLLVLLGRFSTQVYGSYSLFYGVGTLLAIQIPVVGWTPLKSLEQLAPCVVFLSYQVLQFCEVTIRRYKYQKVAAWKYRVKMFVCATVLGIVLIVTFVPIGYFGPISSRVRGLFVTHTKTGNPLVDSVAEHQPADSKSYYRYLQHLCYFAPLGYVSLLFNFGDGPSFLLAYATAAYFLSHKMVRLLLLTAPIASILAGISIGRLMTWSFQQLWTYHDESVESSTDLVEHTKNDRKAIQVTKERRKKPNPRTSSKAAPPPKKYGYSSYYSSHLIHTISHILQTREGVSLKRALVIGILLVMYHLSDSFCGYCWSMSKAMSSPSITYMATAQDGKQVQVDDYRQAYRWIRDHTLNDARILSWWDYGYQIAAIANRTTLADGNTWNHEHIALVGKILTTNVEEGYSIARHLADYVLVWAGGGGDDLAKSPHLARIANSVYRHMCPGDPTCRKFGTIDHHRTPSKMMKESLLYSLVRHEITPGVKVDPTKFKEMFQSKYGKVRIYKLLNVDKESKKWTADPRNKVCDVEGGWVCKGQYPPALNEVVAKKKNFAQLEDFNVPDEDEEYQMQYFEHLNNPEQAKSKARQKEREDVSANLLSEKHVFYHTWEDTESTTRMWNIIHIGSVQELEEWLELDPLMAHMRSSDGRGPMWWAFETKQQDIVQLLMKHSVGHTDKDKYGLTPIDLIQLNPHSHL